MKNFALLGFDAKRLKEISSFLSYNLNMYMLDVEQFITYQLFDCNKMKNLCGVDYYNQQEEKIFKTISEFENTVYVINFKHLGNYLKFCSSTPIIYLKTDKEKLMKMFRKNPAQDMESDFIVSYIDFEDIDRVATSNSKIVINDSYRDSIKERLLKMLKKENV